jgi:hypothetical protein
MLDTGFEGARSISLVSMVIKEGAIVRGKVTEPEKLRKKKR